MLRWEDELSLCVFIAILLAAAVSCTSANVTALDETDPTEASEAFGVLDAADVVQLWLCMFCVCRGPLWLGFPFDRASRELRPQPQPRKVCALIAFCTIMRLWDLGAIVVAQCNYIVAVLHPV